MNLTKTRIKTLLIFMATTITAVASELVTNDSIIGRPYEQFDVTAYCSYSSFHPNHYLTDNNWDIICAFITPGSTSRLDSLGIAYSKSQLRLLEVGDLLQNNGKTYSTKIQIFDKRQTNAIRLESRQFADSIFHIIKPDIKEFIHLLGQNGYTSHVYSIVFSYLLDGYIWSDGMLTPPNKLSNHGTWNGAYWAMYEKRPHDKIGTNGYGPVKVNWTDELGYWPGDKLLFKLAMAIMEGDTFITDENLKESLAQWGLTDKNGKITVPVLHPNNGDALDCLVNRITETISNAVKSHCIQFSGKYNIASRGEAEIIFYHEVMWDLLSILEANKIIEKPKILKGDEVGKIHFGDIVFISIDKE